MIPKTMDSSTEDIQPDDCSLKVRFCAVWRHDGIRLVVCVFKVRHAIVT